MVLRPFSFLPTSEPRMCTFIHSSNSKGLIRFQIGCLWYSSRSNVNAQTLTLWQPRMCTFIHPIQRLNWIPNWVPVILILIQCQCTNFNSLATKNVYIHSSNSKAWFDSKLGAHDIHTIQCQCTNLTLFGNRKVK
jgi:hypothetical protein